MKPTPEQLNELSDYELNCAVAEKLGYKVVDSYDVDDSTDIIVESNGLICPVNYCIHPNDYMPIAIEHGISIIFNEDRTKVKCIWNQGEDKYSTPWLPKAQTGRAVVIAFLLMGDE